MSPALAAVATALAEARVSLPGPDQPARTGAAARGRDREDLAVSLYQQLHTAITAVALADREHG